MKPFLVQAGRAFRRRCPRCGAGGMFTSWFRTAPHCSACGMTFERDEGDWTGAVAINLVVTEAVFGIVLIGGALLTWPDVPWVTLMMGGAALNAAVPVLFYPYAKGLWIALDLTLHPLETMEEMEADLRRPNVTPP